MYARTKTFGLALAHTLPLILWCSMLRAQERVPPAEEAAGVPELRLVRADARSAVIEVRVRYLALAEIREAGRAMTIVDFEGSAVLTGPDHEGRPDIRHRLIPVALPASGGSTVRVLSADFEDIAQVDLAPVPRTRLRDGMLEVASYETDPVAFSATTFQPGVLAELMDNGRTRSLHTGVVKVFPVHYNPSARTVRRYTRILLEVDYGPAAPERVERADYELFRGGLVNSPSVLSWLGGRPRVAVSAAPSVLASGEWYRLTVNEEGIYRLDAQYLSAAGISLSTLDPRKIRLFGNGGRELPEDVTQPRPADLTEIAVHVEGEDDGRFDAGDYVLFYGRSTRGWRYDPAARKFRHYISRYSESNYYWLTIGADDGKRMPERPSSAGTPLVTADRTVESIAIEEEKINLLRSGKDWYGQTINGPTGSFTHVNQLPGLVPGSTVSYRYALAAHSSSYSTFTVRDGQTLLGTHTLPPISTYVYAQAGVYEASGPSTLAGNTSQVNFAFTTNAVGSEAYIDWLEINYPRMLWAVNNQLRFRSPDTTALVEYTLQQFSSVPVLLDVSRHDSVVMITGLSGAYSFRADETSGRVSEYVAAGSSAWKAPVAVQRVANQNLRGVTDGADFIIVTSKEYRAAADRLKDHREDPAHGNLRTVVADVEEIYNEFGGGIPDIVAIRDYLKYAYDTWTLRPRFVLFFGWASYDYKGLLGSQTSYVPTWQSAESRDDVLSYATDDFFVMFSRSFTLSLVPGRISVRTPAEAEAMVDKIKGYEESSAQDAWKMRLLFIGDDSWTSEREDGILHTRDAETLSSTRYTPAEFEKRKIYIAEYPTANTSQGRRKPGAYQAIIDAVNEGVLMLNYSGHGNPSVLAHERIFEVNTSVPQLFNRNRPALFFLATCNFSQYDDPKITTGSEVLVNRREGGAVSVISASRKVYAGANAALNQGTYEQMFKRDSFGRVVVERPATALFLYKVLRGNGDNDQKFFFWGDPTMELEYPKRYARIDSINGEPVDSVGGAPRQTLINLRSLSRVTVSGSVRDQNDVLDPSFNGTLGLTVNDASQPKMIPDFYPGVNYEYLAPGGVIFRGAQSVTNGRFRGSFIVPKDIQYADSTSAGRLSGYFWNGSMDGGAYTGNVRITGSDSTALSDRDGPAIAIYLKSRAYREGDMVDENPLLIVEFVDSSGINTSGSGIGHRIEAWLDNALESTDLTALYTSALDDYRRGSLERRLTGLSNGRHTIRIRAWDSFNNSSTSQTQFQVASASPLTIADLFTYPNPFTDQTKFTFRHNGTEALSITVKVYTIAGRAIRTLDWVSGAGDTFVSIPWDGSDRDGDQIANGVYLYKIVVRTLDGRLGTEAIGKLTRVR